MLTPCPEGTRQSLQVTGALDNRSVIHYLGLMPRNMPPVDEALEMLVHVVSLATDEADDEIAILTSWDRAGKHGLTYSHLRQLLLLATDHGGGPYRNLALREIAKER